MAAAEESVGFGRVGSSWHGAPQEISPFAIRQFTACGTVEASV